MLRFSILALLLFQSRASDLLQQECTIDSYCEDTGNPAQDELEEDDEDVVISESSYASPAPKSTSGFAADLGEPQLLDAAYSDEILEAVDRARSYVLNEVMVDKKYEKVRSICKNSHQNCAFWSVLGECENNPAYMNVNCAPLCNSCEMLRIETRCPMDPDAIDALYPGDVNKMFEKIAFSPAFQQYEPVVLSRPPDGPWIIMFEKAVSDEEADRLIELGGEEGYERSSDVGDEREDGTFEADLNSGRTSTNAWCVDECYEDPVAKRVMQRMENITGIPELNSENLQLLKYDKSQFYQTHNDFIPHQVERPCGVRVLTFYIYLNDVEEGGGTDFPHLEETVMPKRGRAVLWPSVFDRNPNKKDPRTDHQALPVIKGVKYGANAWVHQRDFKTPNNRGC